MPNLLFNHAGRFVLLAAFIAFTHQTARADDDGMTFEALESMPRTSCGLTFYTSTSARAWSGARQVSLPELSSRELSREGDAIDPYFDLSFLRQRNGAQDWETKISASAQRGSRLYAVDSRGPRCATRGERALRRGETIDLSLVDDQRGATAPVRAARRCFIAEDTRTGDRIGVELVCRQHHSRGRDRERQLELEAGARQAAGSPRGGRAGGGR
jgi:hypothetical protein